MPVTVPAVVETPVQTPELTNVYSIYYYYFEDFGWLGFMAIFICLGILLGFLFNRRSADFLRRSCYQVWHALIWCSLVPETPS